MTRTLSTLGLGLVLLSAACGSTNETGSGFDGGHDGGLRVSEGGLHSNEGGLFTSPDSGHVLDVSPSGLKTLTVNAGASSPTESYTATWNGVATNASWSIDRG